MARRSFARRHGDRISSGLIRHPLVVAHVAQLLPLLLRLLLALLLLDEMLEGLRRAIVEVDLPRGDQEIRGV